MVILLQAIVVWGYQTDKWFGAHSIPFQDDLTLWILPQFAKYDVTIALEVTVGLHFDLNIPLIES